MVTFVPPVVGPVFGVTVWILSALKVKPWDRVPTCPSGFVTVTSTVPSACAGVLAVIDVALATLTFVAAVPPKATVAPLTKFVPLIVTDVPPAIGPLLGATLVIVGPAGAAVTIIVPTMLECPVPHEGCVQTQM